MKENKNIYDKEAVEDDLLLDDVQPFTVGPKKVIIAYPSSWADNL